MNTPFKTSYPVVKCILCSSSGLSFRYLSISNPIFSWDQSFLWIYFLSIEMSPKSQGLKLWNRSYREDDPEFASELLQYGW